MRRRTVGGSSLSRGSRKATGWALKHVVEERHHAVLDLLGGEDAVALRCVVDAEARVRQPVQCPVVVFSLEAEVALDHDDDLAVDELSHSPQPSNVSFDQSKLLLRLCTDSVCQQRVAAHTAHSQKKIAIAADLFSPSVCRCRGPAHTTHSQQRSSVSRIETRQTVCERLNDVLGEKPFGFRPFILKYNGISQINSSYGFCQNRFDRKAASARECRASQQTLRTESVTHLCRVQR